MLYNPNYDNKVAACARLTVRPSMRLPVNIQIFLLLGAVCLCIEDGFCPSFFVEF